MAEADNSYRQAEPGLSIYLIALVLGSGVAFAIASLWLDVTSFWVALTVGATLALLGVFMTENIGEAIVFSMVLGLLVFSIINFMPGLIAIKAGIVPGACGLSVGKLVAGVWKEIAS
jgi:xanthine/uracil/vitamin C permease (AzgA family)